MSDNLRDREQWLPVVGHEGAYEVSDQGRVRSLDRNIIGGRGGVPTFRKGTILRLAVHPKTGYQYCSIASRTQLVHRLVLAAFVGPCPEKHEACHHDGNPCNNAAENLYWGTSSANEYDKVRHGTHNHSRKTHCKNGCEFTPENTRWRVHKNYRWRECIACHRRRAKEQEARRG